MFVERRGEALWSAIALRWLKLCLILCVALSVSDGAVRVWTKSNAFASPFIQMSVYWITDFRYLSEQGLLVAAVLFVGARFFERQTLLAVSFDRADAMKLAVKGPDDENIVWIGRRYDSAVEAEDVAAAVSRKLQGASED